MLMNCYFISRGAPLKRGDGNPPFEFRENDNKWWVDCPTSCYPVILGSAGCSTGIDLTRRIKMLFRLFEEWQLQCSTSSRKLSKHRMTALQLFGEHFQGIYRCQIFKLQVSDLCCNPSPLSSKALQSRQTGVDREGREERYHDLSEIPVIRGQSRKKSCILMRPMWRRMRHATSRCTNQTHQRVFSGMCWVVTLVKFPWCLLC